MAEINISVIGNISGKLDNLVIKNRNGKRIIYVWPEKYNASNSKKAVEGRNNFAISVKFAKLINSTPALKEIWRVSKAEGSNSFQKIIKNNAKLVSGGSLTPSNKITPDGSLLKLTSAAFNNKILFLSFLCPLNSNLKFPAGLYICLYFKKDNDSVYFITKGIESSSQDDKYDIEITPGREIKSALTREPNPIIYLALAGGTAYKKKIYWTSTASVLI